MKEKSKTANGQAADSGVQTAAVAVRREGPTAGLISSDVDLQVRTAKAFPRSIGEAKQRAIELATLDQETAASCIYAIPRGGKIIEGLSVRGAEIIVTTFGNLRVSAKTTGEDDNFVYAQAIAWDLESNVAISYETKRRITNRDGERYNEDMVMVTSNAAVSIALRNVVFRIIPKSIINEVYEAVRKTAAGNARTLKQRRTEMLRYFAEQGIDEQNIFDLLSVTKVDDITLDHLTTLRSIATSVKDEVVSVEAIFSRNKEQSEAVSEEKNISSSEDLPSSEDEVVPGEDTSVDKTKPADLAIKKAETINQLISRISALAPGDDIHARAKQLKLLDSTFGRTELKKIELLPLAILQAGLVTLKNQAAEGDEIPV